MLPLSIIGWWFACSLQQHLSVMWSTFVYIIHLDGCTEALLGRGGLWIASPKSRIIHRSDRSSKNLTSSWQKRGNRLRQSITPGGREMSFFGCWPTEAMSWLVCNVQSNGRCDDAPAAAILPKTLRFNYAVYKFVETQEVKVHCTTQRVLWFMPTSNL